MFLTDSHPTRYPNNPIITLSPSTWYTEQVYDYNILSDPSDATKLLMFCSGMAPPAAVGTQSIGLFRGTVSNPYAWTEVGQVLTASEQWENGHVRLGSVIDVSGTFYMFYTGGNPGNGTSIGMATSTNNGATWTKYASNPIITPAGNGRDDGGQHVSEPAVFKEGSNWTIIYSYRTNSVILPGYRYATANNPTAWTKGGVGDILTTNPLFGEFHQVHKIDGLYYLVYEAGSATVPYRLFAAVSSAITGPFTNLEINPILSESGAVGAWDRYHVATPCLVQINGRWRLFYSGAGDLDEPYYFNTWPCGLAEYDQQILVSQMGRLGIFLQIVA